MNILIVGGAGYIGSVVTESLLDAGHEVIVVDNFSTGHRAALDERHADDVVVTTSGCAGLCCREPMVTVDITIPSDSMGNVTGDLSSRRGRILGNTTLAGDRVVVHGEAPLAEFQNYQSQLKSMTGGAGTFTMAFSRYEPVPPNIQQDLVARYESPPED